MPASGKKTLDAGNDWAMVAAVVDRFEKARRASPEAELVEYLLKPDDPLYARVAVELVRVDLEYRWTLGAPKGLAAYRCEVPRLFDDPETLSEAAFEEYRLRRLSGDPVAPEEYRRQFGVAAESWPPVGASRSLSDTVLGEETEVVFPKPGEMFAGFRLVRELGRGAFAVVFLAEQNDLARRPVVLKVSRRRTLEPEHLARLQHTNIVPIYSVHEASGLIAVCMPYCGDRTLADVTAPAIDPVGLESTLARADDDTLLGAEPATQPATPITPRGREVRFATTNEVLRLLRDIAAGLAHAHARGIVHRDLKPANLLVGDDGRPLLLDFNLSNSATVYGEASLMVGGTLPYMAPEHLDAVRVGGDIDRRCDVFSLGVILFELLAGRRPFPDHSVADDLDGVIQTAAGERRSVVPSVSTFAPTISPSLDALVSKCLAPAPSARYQSADDLVEDLTRHLDDLPLRHAPNPSSRERLAKWRRRHPLLTSAGSVGLAGALVAALFAGLWLARADRVALLEARGRYDQFQQALPAARAALSLPDTDHDLLRDGIEQVRQTLGSYVTESDKDWRKAAAFAYLSTQHQQTLQSELAEMSYLLARAEKILAGGADHAEATARLERARKLNQTAADLVGVPSPTLAGQRREIDKLLGNGGDDAPPSPPEGPRSPFDDYLAPQIFLERRDYAAALSASETLRDQQPTDPVAWLLLGNAAAGVGELSRAEGAYTTSAALQPGSYVARYNRGLCRLQKGAPLAAIDDFGAVLEIRPGMPCVLLNRALANESAGRLDAALADLDAALATGEAPPRALLLRSRIRRQLGDGAGAQNDLAAGIAAPPADVEGWVARGIARLDANPDAALADFQQALELNPLSVLALKNVVHVTADRLQRSEEALAALDDWIEIEPKNAHALVGRAVLYARQGDRASSLRDLEAALTASQEPVIAFQAAGALALSAAKNNHDAERGLALLSQAIDCDPRLLARATSDPDIAALRKAAGFQRIFAAYHDLAAAKREISRPIPPDI